MKDRIIWTPVRLPTMHHGKRMVYIKHYVVPFVGLLSAADTAFTVPAYIRVNGKRISGFVTPSNGMAYTQEHDKTWFVEFKRQGGAPEVQPTGANPEA